MTRAQRRYRLGFQGARVRKQVKAIDGTSEDEEYIVFVIAASAIGSVTGKGEGRPLGALRTVAENTRDHGNQTCRTPVIRPRRAKHSSMQWPSERDGTHDSGRRYWAWA